jgi:hypothetical protein
MGDAEIDDAILREAFKPFALYEQDAAKVEDRYGLTPAEQIKAGLRSAPHYVHRLMAAHAVLSRFGPQRIAPFYDDGEGLRINAPSHGLVMAVERRGRLRAFLHYKSADDLAPVWVTSSRLPNGSTARPSVHVVNPETAAESGVCVLVDHALEAAALGASGLQSFVAINGLHPDALASQLREEWPPLRAVVVETLAPVRAHERALRRLGLFVKEGGDEL